MASKNLIIGWRVLIAIGGGWAVCYFLTGPLSLRTFTVQVDAAVAVYFGWMAVQAFFTGQRRAGSAIIGGGLVVFALLMGVIYEIFSNPAYALQWNSLLAHIIVPLLVLADWLFVSTYKRDARWWYPLAWMIYPAAYLVMTLVVGQLIQTSYEKYQYFFLNPTRPNFLPLISLYAVLVLVLGFVVVGAGRLGQRDAPK